MQVAQQIVDALLEGEMPDWLKKKISGKAEDKDGEGSEDEGGGDDDGGEKKPKKSSGSASASTDVAGALGKIGH